MANKIVLKKSSVAAKVPLATDLDVGEIAVNLADQKLYSKNAAGTVILVGSSASGSGSPAGSTNQIQYNSAGAFAASAGLTFDGTNFATTGSATATTFIPSGSTAPTNGLYLPAANTLGLSVNSTNIARVNSTGLSIGTAITPAARLQIGTTALSSAAWTTSGLGLRIDAATYTSSAGLTGTVVTHSVAQPTFAATTASQTVTNAATLYIANAPAAGTNVTITNAYALYIASGFNFMDGPLSVAASASGYTFPSAAKSLLKVGASAVTYTDQSNNYASGPSFNTAGTYFNYPNAPDSADFAYANYLAVNSFNGNSVNGTTWTRAATLYIAGAPFSSTGTITDTYGLAINCNGNDGGIYIAPSAGGAGTGISVAPNLTSYFSGTLVANNPTGPKFQIGSNTTSSASWGTSGIGLRIDAATFTSTAGFTGTVAANSVAQPTFASGTGAQTVTNAATLYIAAAPAAGTNVTITNSYALYIAAGRSFFGGGTVLGAGTATVAPLTFTSGTSLTSPVAGTFEFDGSTFFSTDDVTDGRGFIPSVHFFRLTADGSNLTSAGNFFGATSGMSLDAGIFYEIEVYFYFGKSGATAASFYMVFTQAPVNNNILLIGNPVAGGTTAGNAQSVAINGSTATTLTINTATLTAGEHGYTLQSMFQANATTGGTLNIQASGGAVSGVTPRKGSYYKITRLPAANTGAYV
jgi:hypothetical protein